MDENKINLALAPLQGFTDRIYRSLHAKLFGEVDRYFVPYIEFKNDGSIKKSHQRDVQFSDSVAQVPQVLCNSFDHLYRLSIYLKELGYSEVNLNLGCPYPMVAKRKKGSGLLAYPHEIKNILQLWFENPPVKLSVKLRLGYENKDEIYPVLDVLNSFPLDEIILHSRIGKNLYKGRADTEAFAQALEYSNHPITYNGDIDSFDRFRQLSEKFPTIDNWMIGRGILCNPFFAEEIKQLTPKTDMEKKSRMKVFIDELWQAYEEQYGHPSQALNKMKQHWIYLSQWFSNPHKVYKMIKKSNSEYKYKERVGVIFKECD